MHCHAAVAWYNLMSFSEVNRLQIYTDACKHGHLDCLGRLANVVNLRPFRVKDGYNACFVILSSRKDMFA